jgi:predicted RNA binding protein YcfA (HicA-like mRNA interferase family)
VSRLSNLSGKDAVKAFQKAGWQKLGQVGSHVVMIKPGVRVNLSIPQHRELSVERGLRSLEEDHAFGLIRGAANRLP